MDEKPEKEPMLTTSTYDENGRHTLKEIPYSSLPIERLADLALNGSVEARKVLEKLCGADFFKDLG
jgi:hypothetical protein